MAASTKGSAPVRARRVVHVLPVDLARGAQTYARSLRETLDGEAFDGETTEHRTVVVFESPPVALNADVALAVPSGLLRRVGFDPRAALRLSTALGRLRPSVVVAHGGEALKYGALARPAGSRLVYYKIGTAVGMGNPVRRRLYRGLARRVDAVAAVSDDTAEEALRELGLPASRITVVPNGRDPSAYERATPPVHVRSRPRLVFVGHLTPTKRPELFLAVVAELRRRHTELDAVLVGDGPLFEHLREPAREAGVEMLGQRDDVAAVLTESDLFVFTSVVAGEGMPGVLIEAGLAALPVVTTDVPGARTVIEDGVSGIVVAVDDRAALVEATHRLTGDAALRARMGQANRARCAEHFTIEASARRWQVLLGTLEQGPAA